MISLEWTTSIFRLNNFKCIVCLLYVIFNSVAPGFDFFLLSNLIFHVRIYTTEKNLRDKIFPKYCLAHLFLSSTLIKRFLTNFSSTNFRTFLFCIVLLDCFFFILEIWVPKPYIPLHTFSIFGPAFWFARQSACAFPTRLKLGVRAGSSTLSGLSE